MSLRVKEERLYVENQLGTSRCKLFFKGQWNCLQMLRK